MQLMQNNLCLFLSFYVSVRHWNMQCGNPYSAYCDGTLNILGQATYSITLVKIESPLKQRTFYRDLSFLKSGGLRPRDRVEDE